MLRLRTVVSGSRTPSHIIHVKSTIMLKVYNSNVKSTNIILVQKVEYFNQKMITTEVPENHRTKKRDKGYGWVEHVTSFFKSILLRAIKSLKSIHLMATFLKRKKTYPEI
jgi:hypothetical protein